MVLCVSCQHFVKHPVQVTECSVHNVPRVITRHSFTSPIHVHPRQMLHHNDHDHFYVLIHLLTKRPLMLTLMTQNQLLTELSKSSYILYHIWTPQLQSSLVIMWRWASIQWTLQGLCKKFLSFLHVDVYIFFSFLCLTSDPSLSVLTAIFQVNLG